MYDEWNVANYKDVYDEWNVANYNFESFKNGRSVTRIIHINSLDVLWF